ncbi:MAG: RNA polymerase sigma factor [Halioglobus sp.]|nr:RNA polymerase sigma factor [Halioglobus sp.]
MTTKIVAFPPRRDVDDEILLHRARQAGARGERARAALLQRHYGWIQERCARVLRNEADDMDAAQNAAMRIYDNLPGFEGRSSLRTWMSTIITRECLGIVRRGERHLLRDHVAQLILLHEELLRPRQESAESDRDDRVAQTLGNLAPKSREVLQLRFYSDLSLEDISATLGISLSAAKMRLYRALDQFALEYEAA